MYDRVSFVLTIFGLLFSLAGIGCGVSAFLRTLAEHDPKPVWPWASRQVARGRSAVVRITRWIRPGKSNVVHAKAGAGAAFARATTRAAGYRSGIQIPPDLPIKEQILLLVERIADAEEVIRRESDHLRGELRDVRAKVDAHTKRLARADEELARADEDIKQLALALSLGTVRRQIVGLILVGIGTVFMAVPALFGL